MKELTGKKVFVIGQGHQQKDDVTSTLCSLGYKPSPHDIAGIPDAPWVFVDLDSKLYCTGKVGVKIAEPIYWHQITLDEFKTIQQLYTDGDDLSSFIAHLDSRYKDLDWRDFPLTDDPNYDLHMAQVGLWRKQFADALRMQTDSEGRNYVTEEQVEELQSDFDDRDVLFAIENDKDPAELGAKLALRYRKFTPKEIAAFISEFRRLLMNEYKSHCEICNYKYTDERYEELARPCTDTLARIYLEGGSTPQNLLEYLYLVYPINEWDFTPRQDI